VTPVDQQFLHLPDQGQHGDCMRACIASLLDLPIADVPHFAQIDADGGDNFWIGVTDFCRSRGFAFVTVKGSFVWSADPIYHIIAGPSPRAAGVHHAVIGLNGRVHFDPHPSRAGLAGDPSEWSFDLLVRPHGGV
jgi:hypothetical protein